MIGNFVERNDQALNEKLMEHLLAHVSLIAENKPLEEVLVNLLQAACDLAQTPQELARIRGCGAIALALAALEPRWSRASHACMR